MMTMSRIPSIPVRKISLELDYTARTYLDLYLYPDPDDDRAPDTLVHSALPDDIYPVAYYIYQAFGSYRSGSE